MSELHKEVRSILSKLRKLRGFDPEVYLRSKVALLNQYMSRSGLSAAVVGVSGGVDSAVVLAMLALAKKEPGSPIKRIVGALLPYYIAAGTTNQSVATTRGKEVVEAFGAECVLLDLSDSFAVLKSASDAALGTKGDAWASGQLVSYLRTPALFYLTSLLAQQNFPALVVGTTNRDEGGYIGYFGKAADAMVDLQLISDLHKSEVFAVGRLLGVPQSVLNAEPTGDIYDGRNDEQLIGAPYDFIELYSLFRSLLDSCEQDRLLAGLGAEARVQFDRLSVRLSTLNRQNSHKYLGGSPSVHLDLYERAVPGGWRAEVYEQHASQAVDASRFVNQFELAAELVESLDRWSQAAAGSEAAATCSSIRGFGQSALQVQTLLSESECQAIKAQLDRQSWIPVGLNGMRRDFDQDEDRVGSWRASCFDERLARQIWHRLAPVIPSLRLTDQFTPTDGGDGQIWRAVGVNPLMRFIRYQGGGLLIPHYDAPYNYHDGKRTLMSVVIYLSEGSAETGGATRFILDSQRHLPLAERNLADWSGTAEDNEVVASVIPSIGAALVFDHRVLHDSQVLSPGMQKLIMRTDIVFERRSLPGNGRVTVSKPLGRMEEPQAGADPVKLPALGAGDLAPPAVQAAPGESSISLARLNEDPHFASAYRLHGSLELAVEAGFFDDRLNNPSALFASERLDWLATPVEKIARRLRAIEQDAGADNRPLVVLASTGAFCPLHRGHIEMMEVARRELEKRGVVVLGGYLCPDHDEYVARKCGAQTLDAAHRLLFCQAATAGSDWLMADGWAALECDRALNFTTIIQRLEAYLSKRLLCHRPVQVAYVFGSDNARFTGAFAGRGRCVCVLRPGSEGLFARYAEQSLTKGNPYIVFSAESGLAGSSTAVRAGQSALLSQAAAALYQRWTGKSESVAQSCPLGIYYARHEGDWAVEPWLTGGRSPLAVRQAWWQFCSQLMDLLRRCHRSAKLPDCGFELEFRTANLCAQRVAARSLLAGQTVISLDPCIEGDFNLAVSRHFSLSTGQQLPEIGERPGFPSLWEQIRALPAGEYVLFDDDIATGNTVRTVLSLLPETVRVKRVSTLTASSERTTGNVLDIFDFRDMLAGSREAGLVVRMPDGKLARSPYCLPYVSPACRLTIPLSQERAFSAELWRLNERFFRSVQPAICLSEANSAFIALMRHVGFDPGCPMADICAFHAERLNG